MSVDLNTLRQIGKTFGYKVEGYCFLLFFYDYTSYTALNLKRKLNSGHYELFSGISTCFIIFIFLGNLLNYFFRHLIFRNIGSPFLISLVCFSLLVGESY